MKVAVLLALFAPIAAADDRVPPPTREQSAQISKLLTETQFRDLELKAEIQALQRELTEAYAAYDLDEQRITQLQEQIAASQQELLANYHKLQVGMRKIMGREQFRQVKRRIDLYLKTAEERQSSPKPTEGKSKDAE